MKPTSFSSAFVTGWYTRAIKFRSDDSPWVLNFTIVCQTCLPTETQLETRPVYNKLSGYGLKRCR